MSFFGTSRRVARRTSRRTSRRWGAYNQTPQGAPYEEEVSPQQQGYTPTQTQQPEDPVKLLQVRLAKGEITPEQYQASLKVLQGA
jgi:hypothetical protein